MRCEKCGNSLTYTKFTKIEKVKLPDGTILEKTKTYEKYCHEDGSPSICNVYNIGDNNNYVNQNNAISFSSNSGNVHLKDDDEDDFLSFVFKNLLKIGTKNNVRAINYS